MNYKITMVMLLAVLLGACTQKTSQPETFKSSLFQYDEQIDGIISQMTLEEKVNMLHGKYMFVSAGVERLGIADMIYADGPFGIREEMQPKGWAPLGWENDKATFFPTGSALAATWSPELAYAYGTGMAKEARLRGKDVILGPAINIQRIPTGGRTYEYMSEDPFLSSQLAVEYTKGAQDNGVAACLKHYALNNQENNRGTVNVIIGERAMREIYLPPFKAAVQEADAYSVMSAYNKVNGWWCAENDVLLNQILRDEWGFGGFVVSDWSGTHSTVESVKHGLNVEMPDSKYLGAALLDSVNAGAVSEDVIDLRVREILRVRMAIDPVPAEEANQVITSQPESQKIAYDVASKSVVLLKNEGILPLDLSEKPLIAVIGENAVREMGSGGIGAGVKTLYEVTPLEGLKNKIGDKAEIQYAQGYVPVELDYEAIFGNKPQEKIDREEKEKAILNKKLNKEAVELAAKADLVLFIGGDNRAVETEANDRKTIFLPSGQDDLIKQLSVVNENIVTVLVSGAPNDLNAVQPLSKALVQSWFNGTEGGNALADILLGNISPSGRLPFTLPIKLEDSPAYALGNYPQGAKKGDIFVDLVDEKESEAHAADGNLENDPNTAYYSEESLVGYRWFDTKNKPVMYPFGHGLSYTEFAYADLNTSKESYGADETISLSFNLSNAGEMVAEEVVQVYVHRINPSVEWPFKELKAFTRVALEPGQSQTVTLDIPVEKLQYWNEENHAWDNDLCDIELLVGASSGDIRLKKQVALK
ncbi:glycoside hydrolase family 3 C-terminal domain-containing protein [Draconibacterium sp. IB214405]|uniref:glycoside hydrolase family 3 C-terminal domain-containing protein n=1 Tax=Draconibacterium sp. IB214405 TaxID=3097352 RepID=UPI002A116CEE|nr:glycoside hydrolase family 3 C-terminal domain-containing protein [Draconibacterium sp. IB214405]MDX8341737.1 glycoside hydrolase family 3 C-terminal domain-containing protein [Draconibacterium sp. IB214405]